MKTFAAVSLLALACQAAPQEKPAKPLDPTDPKSLAEHVIFNTRGQMAYETTFKATLSPPKGDKISYEGRCVWVSPGVLFIQFTATGNVNQKIVRVGNTVWAYHHELEDWFPADEMGMNGASRGIQNPDEILKVLLQNLGSAKITAPGELEAEFDGASLEKIMQAQASKGAFDWKASKARLTLSADAQTRLRKFTCTASLRSTDPEVLGEVGYAATVELVDYNGASGLQFRNAAGKIVPLSDEITKSIEAIKKEKK